MLADDIIARLKERVPDLQNRVEGASGMANLPQVTPAARVIASGLLGGQPDAGTGIYRQSFDETVSVYLVFRNVQGAGGNELDLFDTLKFAVIEALAGWAPESAVGVLRLTRAQIDRFETGTLIFRIDFTIGNQLRIIVT